MAACQVTPAQLPIDILIDQIKAEFVKSETPSPDTIKGLLSTYITAGHQDWREFALFNSIKYSRNLLEFNENFELIVLCWLPGQESPIHNHSGQNCWMSVLEGEMQEVYYNWEDGVMTEGTAQVHSPGEVGFIADEIALHKVRPVSGAGCTMHLYSKPIPWCNLYCPATGKVTKRQLGFFSRRGQKLAEGDPAAISCYVELKKQMCHGDSSCPAEYKELLQQLEH